MKSFQAAVSRETIFYILFLFGLAPITQHIRRAVESSLGTQVLTWMIWTVFAAAAAVVLWFLRTIPWQRLIVFASIAAVGIAGALFMDIAVERMHILFYGGLGWLVARDQLEGKTSFWPAVIAFACIVPVFEEAFQGILPSRVADIRDVFLGLGSVCWGAVLHAVTAVEKRDR